MTQPLRFAGGQSVKANTLNRGDYIRSPKNPKIILVVMETGSTIFARGLDENDVEFHRFFGKEEMATRVTQVTTETSVMPGEGTGQE